MKFNFRITFYSDIGTFSGLFLKEFCSATEDEINDVRESLLEQSDLIKIVLHDGDSRLVFRKVFISSSVMKLELLEEEEEE